MKITIGGRNTGIDWFESKLCDLEHSDDVVLFANILDLYNLDRLDINSKGLGLIINRMKIKVMPDQFTPGPALTIDDDEIKINEDFKYLGTILTNRVLQKMI